MTSFSSLRMSNAAKTRVEWRKLTGIRPFIDRSLSLETEDDRANLRERCSRSCPLKMSSKEPFSALRWNTRVNGKN